LVVRQLDLSFIHTRQSVVVTNINQTFPYISPTHLIKGGGGFSFLLLSFCFIPLVIGLVFDLITNKS